MKQIVLTLCIFFAFITYADAGKLYRCIDRDGNAIITDIQQDGMRNCVLKDSYEDSSPEELAIKKDKAIVKAQETPAARKSRIENCISCCTNKQLSCYNFTADNRLCAVEVHNCDSTCNSEGASPSSWSDCWSQPDK